MSDYDTFGEEIFESEEGFLSPMERVHGKVVEYRQESYYDVTVYSDGFEYRYYVGD